MKAQQEARTHMNIEEIESKLSALDETLAKLRALVADAKVCSSDITKALIMGAVKKYAAVVSDFKVE